LRKSGQFELEATTISVDDELKLVALADKPVDSANRLLFHKTTQRDFYSSALKQWPDCDDVIFWNERGEITESSIANVVVRIGDELVTPPVESGLLSGTFRDELLAEAKIYERVITVEELLKAEELFLINSVRTWMPAKLVTEVSTTSR